MNEQVLKVLQRIKNSQDGTEFMEYLASLSMDNYEAFKGSGSGMNDIHKGYAIAIDALISSFASCDDLLNKKEPEKDYTAHY